MQILKFLLTAPVIALLLNTLTLPAHGGTEYSAQTLGGSAEVTWVFRDRPDARGVIGYACFTRDTIEAMSRDAFAERYELFIPPDEVDFSVRPLNAVSIRPAGSGWIAVAGSPTPMMQLLSNAELDEMGEWFSGNSQAEGLGRSCVDGGISGATRYLERSHGIDVGE